MEHLAIRPVPRRGKHLQTFSDIRRAAEKRLAHGLDLDFDQIMLDIAALRRRLEKPIKN
jgi:hypothetical protein